MEYSGKAHVYSGQSGMNPRVLVYDEFKNRYVRMYPDLSSPVLCPDGRMHG
nr:hypothetical protein [uncultured Methanospirillum sp.]